MNNADFGAVQERCSQNADQTTTSSDSPPEKKYPDYCRTIQVKGMSAADEMNLM